MTTLNNAIDPDEDYLTEEEDYDLEDENEDALREIEVDDDMGEPDPEGDYLEDPFDDLEDEEDEDEDDDM